MPRGCLTEAQKEKAMTKDIWKCAVDSIIDTFQIKKRMTKAKTADAIGIGRNTWTNWQNGTMGDFESVVVALHRAGYTVRIEKR